jgi:predicted DNA-binding transcriptional regulator AlpA
MKSQDIAPTGIQGPQDTSPLATLLPRAGAGNLMDVHAVAGKLSCSWRTVLRLADRGAMPFGVKLGSLRRWSAIEINEWMEGGCKPVRSPGAIRRRARRGGPAV